MEQRPNLRRTDSMKRRAMCEASVDLAATATTNWHMSHMLFRMQVKPSILTVSPGFQISTEMMAKSVVIGQLWTRPELSR